MTLNFENESTLVLDLGMDAEELARQVIETSLDLMDCPYEAEVNLTITDSEEVHRINKEFRNIDHTTDVLSFPMINFEKEGDFSFLEDDASSEDDFNPETGELLLGDIVINAERVLSQAREYGHSVKREYSFLITHSILHLCGFDHMEKEEAERMEGWQNKILDHMGITR